MSLRVFVVTMLPTGVIEFSAIITNGELRPANDSELSSEDRTALTKMVQNIKPDLHINDQLEVKSWMMAWSNEKQTWEPCFDLRLSYRNRLETAMQEIDGAVQHQIDTLREFQGDEDFHQGRLYDPFGIQNTIEKLVDARKEVKNRLVVFDNIQKALEDRATSINAEGLVLG